MTSSHRLHQLVQLAKHVDPDFEPAESISGQSLTKKDTVTQLLLLKVSAFMSSPQTKTHSAGKNDPEVGRLPILRHCCCSHGVSDLTLDRWLLYIFSLYSTTCFSGCFSDYEFYCVSDNVHYVTLVHLSWTALKQKSGSKLQ